MPRRALRTRQDCEDFIQGCLFMGTGGGGSAERGLAALLGALDQGLELSWVDPSDIPDDAWTCSIYNVGSIAPPGPEVEAQIERHKLSDQLNGREMEAAINELSAYAGVEIKGLVPVELGASNTPEPLVTGARMGIPVIDGDYAGRAVPEEMQSTPYLYGKSSYPLVSLDRWGNVVVLKQATNPYMLERITTTLSMASFGVCTIAATLLNGIEMKETVVPGTLTRCLEIGRAIRNALEQRRDPVRAVAEHTDAWTLFEGTVAGKDWEDRDGFMFGTIHIDGSGPNAGSRMDIWLQNENHVSWIDGKPFVCSPDLIVVVDRETGQGFTNDIIDAGHRVAVLGLKGVEDFRSEFGLASSGPRYFGFDIDYVPIETLMQGTHN